MTSFTNGTFKSSWSVVLGTYRGEVKSAYKIVFGKRNLTLEIQMWIEHLGVDYIRRTRGKESREGGKLLVIAGVNPCVAEFL
jgi:hypothetical protein